MIEPNRVQPPTTRRLKRFAEPEITSAVSVWRSMLAASVNSVEKRRAARAYDPRLEMFGFILLARAFVVLTVVILLVRLGQPQVAAGAVVREPRSARARLSGAVSNWRCVGAPLVGARSAFRARRGWRAATRAAPTKAGVPGARFVSANGF